MVRILMPAAFKRVIRASLETIKIVGSLPKLDID
jgi:hypothetical protein